MGAALEWLGADRCRALADRFLTDIDTRRSTGDEIWAACPWHDETTKAELFPTGRKPTWLTVFPVGRAAT